MSAGTLDEEYFEWLYTQIAAVRNRNPSRSYWQLCKQLYTTIFSWSVPNDDNRVEDGRDLRYEFLGDQSGGRATEAWAALECSVLEMLVALARRASFESFGEPGEWFRKFMQNLRLEGYTDSVYSDAIAKEVRKTLTRVVNRTYAQDGGGGIFPLREPASDQRKVELWYQMSAYLLEGDYIDHGPLV